MDEGGRRRNRGGCANGGEGGQGEGMRWEGVGEARELRFRRGKRCLI